MRAPGSCRIEEDHRRFPFVGLDRKPKVRPLSKEGAIRDAGPILAQMMVARMAGTPARDLQRTDKVDLIVRGSTGPVPKWGGNAWSH